MNRNHIIAWVITVSFIALTPVVGATQTDKVKTSMAALQAKTAKLGAAKVQGNDLYFGNTKASNDLVRTVKKEHGAAASIFLKSGEEYKRVGTTVKKEDGTLALGSALENSPAIARLNRGEGYYGDATVFRKTYDAGYEPIKDASGTVIGAYFVGYKK